MATTENEVLLIAKDADGNLYLVYPVTKASQVDGLDELLALKADKKTLLELDTTTQHSSMSDYTSSGMYWINPGVTTDVPGGQWGFLRVFACGNILQEFTGYSENSRAVRMFVNNAWTTWSREHYGSGNGWSWEIRPDGKPSVTRFRVLERGTRVCRLSLEPITGRTHQLRLHCAYMGFPILGDPQYGSEASMAFSREKGFETQLLLAKRLEFAHPITGEPLELETKLALPELGSMEF